MVETSAFNFPDQTSLYYSCKIRLCYSGENCESITPPKCGTSALQRLEGSSTDASVELAGHGDEHEVHGKDLNDDQLISSTAAEAEEEEENKKVTSSPLEAPKSTERAFERDTEATTDATTTARAQAASSTSSDTSSSSTTTSTARPRPSPTTANSDLASSSSTVFIPADFPRPEGLEKADSAVQGSGEAPVDAWMVSDIPEASENRNGSEEEQQRESSTQPVQLLKKNRKRAPQAQKPEETAAGSTTPRSASRQQRDATPLPKRLVEFDLSSPELTIMEDLGECGGGFSFPSPCKFRKYCRNPTPNIVFLQDYRLHQSQHQHKIRRPFD